MSNLTSAVRSGLLVLATLLTAAPLAAREITDIDGRTVKIDRGKAPARARVASQRTRQPRAETIFTITAGGDNSPTDNDYRSIVNAIEDPLLMPGDTIILSGTFDFTAPFAAAAWALGNDGVVSAADDYAVLVPAGLNNITLTATSLGTATIQGPGDLAAVNLEGFLVFDGGDNQNWTISNLRIFDFDLGIGMFNGAGGADAFNGTTIQNNTINLPADLNATVAPTDVNQNIGIHFSFGTNQTIAGNIISIPGDGISDIANFASCVGMQSNTSGGAVYDGLSIQGNVINIQNAQSANPEVILGIWENGFAHTSAIDVSLNQFLNLAGGNDPALNVQRAFRVTSHSSLTTTVGYNNNVVGGANIGFQWIALSNFAGNPSVEVLSNTLTGCATGILVQSNGIASIGLNEITLSGAGGGVHVVTGTVGMQQNRISNGSGDGILIDATAGTIGPILLNDLGGNAGFGLNNLSAGAIAAPGNWWGGNLQAQVAAEVNGGTVTFDPWLASGTDLSLGIGFGPFTFATTSGTITTLAGTNSANTGSILFGTPSLTMTMNGQTAFTLLAEVLSFNVTMLGNDDTFTVEPTGITTTFDGGTGNDTLIGTPAGASWTVSGAGSGLLTGVGTFSNTETLRGQGGADNFFFQAGGSLTGNLDGGLGSDLMIMLAPGATVNVTGPGTLDGVMGNTAAIGGIFDNINGINGAQADLSITKSAPASAAPGQNITFTLTVTNNGPSTATNVVITDNLPAGVTFVSSTTPCTGAPNLSCPIIGAILSGSTVTIGIVVTVNTTTGPIVNTASVSGTETDPNAGNSSSTAPGVVIEQADMAISKSGPLSATSGSNITFTLTVTNNGPDAATNVVVTDVLPAGVTFVSSTPPICTGAPNLTCTVGSLGSGANTTIDIVVNVTASSGSIVNTANVSADQVDGTQGNDSDSATVQANAAPVIPTTSEWGLLLLAAMLSVVALIKMRPLSS